MHKKTILILTILYLPTTLLCNAYQQLGSEYDKLCKHCSRKVVSSCFASYWQALNELAMCELDELRKLHVWYLTNTTSMMIMVVTTSLTHGRNSKSKITKIL